MAPSFIVLHCTGGPQNQSVGSILNHWKNVMKWKLPGYKWLIDAAGTAHELVKNGHYSNGVAGYNQHCLHISYIGGVLTDKTDPINAKGIVADTRTPEQIKTQYELLKIHNMQYPTAVILGHRDFSPDKNRNGMIEPNEWMKACPGYSVREDLDAHRFEGALGRHIVHTRGKVNMRSGWTMNHGIRAIIPSGMPLKYLGEALGWAYVATLSGINLTGWIRRDLLEGLPNI